MVASMSDGAEKVCTRCRKELPLRNALTGRLNFYHDQNMCKPCSLAHVKAYRKTDAGKRAAHKAEVKQWATGKLPKWMRD